MTAQAAAESAAAITLMLLLVVAILSVWALRDRAKHAEDGTAGLELVLNDPTVDEDINHPRLETIDAALALTDRDANPGAVDWLLERRWAEMQRRVS